MRNKPYTARLTYYPTECGEEKLKELLICNKPVFGTGFEKRKKVENNSFDDVAVSSGLVIEHDNSSINIQRAVRRARRQIIDYIVCNYDLDCFITCTLKNDNDFNRFDNRKFVRKLNVWLCNLVQRNGLKYVIVPEYHKNGAIHFHGLCNSSAFNLVDSGTVIRPDKKKPVRRATAIKQGYADNDLKTVFNVANWKYGFSTAIMTDGNREAIARYISKYVSKDFENEKVGGRYFYHGGELSSPRYEYADLVLDDVEHLKNSENFSCYEFEVENYATYFGFKILS